MSTSGSRGRKRGPLGRLPVRCVFICVALLLVVLIAGCGDDPVPQEVSLVGGSTGTSLTETEVASDVSPVSSSLAAPYPLGMAVEFTDHAAAAMVALDKGWFADAGIEVTSYESYVTGVDLAAAVARGDIQAAYICLVPALNVVANAGIPVRIVAGTHKYGYGLVVDPAKVTRVEDLADPAVKVACTQPGAAADVLLHRLCDKSGLSASDMEAKVQRMNPPAQVLALQAGAVDACLMPEHWAALAENLGFTMLATAQDIWPDLEGSVLVVKEDLIRDHPEVVEGLVEVTRKATEWIGQNPDEAAAIVAAGLSATGQMVLPAKAADVAAKLQVTPEVVARSMSHLEYTVSLDPAGVQEVIDYVTALGYLKTKIDATQILDLSFLGE